MTSDNTERLAQPSANLTGGMAQPLRIGILGCANIARQFARDVMPSHRVRIVSVASRNTDTATAFAAAQGIDRAHGSYEALLASDDVDAIYLPLPNSLHAEWAIRAMHAGKHVLCEKPLALGVHEAKALFDAASHRGVILLESYPYQFQPQTLDMLGLLKNGAIGAVRLVQTCFGFTLPVTPDNIRMRPELGGGALLDAGSYVISLIRLVMGCAPQRVRADASWADSGVDISAMATLYYEDGRRAQLSCAMDTAYHRRATIVGTQGTIETEFLNHTSAQAGGHPYGYLPSQLRLRRGIANSVPFEDIRSETGSGFLLAAEEFARMVLEDDRAAMRRGAESSLDIAATLEALGRSAREGTVVEVPGSRN